MATSTCQTSLVVLLLAAVCCTVYAHDADTAARAGKDALWYVPSFGNPSYAHIPGTPYFRSAAEAGAEPAERAGKDALWYVPSFGNPSYAHVPGTPYFRSNVEDAVQERSWMPPPYDPYFSPKPRPPPFF